MIPFGLVSSIEPAVRDASGDERSRVILHGGEELLLERTGDLDEGNAGMLIFIDGGDESEYVPWADVERIGLERPAAMYPEST